ncbi:MAG: flagellar export protein FliJ [Thermodesulfobacteriota bacterium]
MKPFRLDSVLKHRKRLEEQASARYTRAKLDLEEARSRLHKSQQERMGLADQLKKKQLEGIDCGELVRYETHILFLKGQIAELENLVNRKQQITESKHRDLINRSKDRKILESLKEKQNSQYRTYLDKKETALLDEIGVVYHDRAKE